MTEYWQGKGQAADKVLWDRQTERQTVAFYIINDAHSPVILPQLHALQTPVGGRAADGSLGTRLLMPHKVTQVLPELTSKLRKLTPERELSL